MPTETVTCKRHPSVETRLFCAECGDPICPRCAVPTPVGQKCPSCARVPKTARVRGKPDQIAKGVGAGVAAAVLGGAALWLIYRRLGFATWILSGLVGYGIARAVLFGSEGNRATVFRATAMVLALVAVAAGWVLSYGWGYVVPPDINVVTYLAAAYGAYAGSR